MALNGLNLGSIFEPQPLATGVAYKKTVYHHNCQGNYELFYYKSCKNKDADIGKNSKLKKICGWDVRTQKITIAINCNSFKIFLTKKWPGIYILP